MPPTSPPTTTDALITAVAPADGREEPRDFRITAEWPGGTATWVCRPICPPKPGDRWSLAVPELLRLRDGPGWDRQEG